MGTRLERVVQAIDLWRRRRRRGLSRTVFLHRDLCRGGVPDLVSRLSANGSLLGLRHARNADRLLDAALVETLIAGTRPVGRVDG